MGVIPFEARRRERTSPPSPPSTMPETEPRPTRLVLYPQ